MPETIAKKRKEPDLSSVGWGGPSRMAGLVREEYLTDLRGTAKIDAYTRMRSDGTVQAMLTSLVLPVIAAGWTAEPGDESPNAARAVELVEAELLQAKHLDVCWEDLLRQILTCVPYGFSACAKQWGVVDGIATIIEFTPLHPRTLVTGDSWIFGQRGRLEGVYQTGNDGTTFRTEKIPLERLLHVVMTQEFGNPEGWSALRGAYKHWLIKDKLYLWTAIGQQRTHVGIPVAKYATQNAGDKANLETFAKNAQTSESAYLVTHLDNVIEMLKMTADTAGAMQLIQHHDSLMAKSVLTQFEQLGQEGRSGSRALGDSQTDLFLTCEEALGDLVAAVINRTVIPDLVRYNIDTDRYPRLACTVSRESTEKLVGFIRQLTTGTNPALTWSETDEDELRERMQFPPREGPRPKPTAPPPAPGQPPAQQSRERIDVRRAAEPPRYRREEPAYQGLADVIAEFGGALRLALADYRADVWRICRLPEPEGQGSAGEFAATFRLDDAQKRALDRATEAFLRELYGADRAAAGFASPAVEDALFQHFEVLGHAIGMGRARELTGAQAVQAVITRDGPEIQYLLTRAFERMSEGGKLRFETACLEGVRSIIVAGAEQGISPMLVAESLSGLYTQYSQVQFERLARTEMAFAGNAGIVDELGAEGIARLRPLVGAMACEVCLGHVGESILVAEAEPGGNIAPYHPHCVCSVEPEETP